MYTNTVSSLPLLSRLFVFSASASPRTDTAQLCKTRPTHGSNRPWVSFCLCETRTFHTVILISYVVAEPVFRDCWFIKIYDATGIVNGYGRRNRISGCRAAQGPERPGQAAVVRWKRCRLPRLSIQLQNTHEPRQFCFSRADGRMRNRSKSGLPGSRESAGRSTLEVLHADVLCIGFDNESVRALIRSAEETNGAEAWRLIHKCTTLKIDNMP